MKTLETYIGKVIKLNPGRSQVTLKEMSTNKELQTEADTDELRQRGIGEGDEFQVLIEEDDKGNKKPVMSKIKK